MGTYPIKERLRDYSIKGISFLFGTVHFTARLTADAARECEAQSIHLIDKGTNKEMVRIARDHSYESKIKDIKIRIDESKKVMEETYRDITKKLSREEQMISNLVDINVIAPMPPTEE